jgi:hypothetical protein
MVHATFHHDDVSWRVRGKIVPGLPETPPTYSHGWLPADPPELDAVEVESLIDGKWVGAWSLFDDDVVAEIEAALWEAAGND